MSGAWAGGKGSKPRKVDTQRYNDNYDAIFGKKETKKSDEKEGSKDKIPPSTIRSE